MTPNQKRLLADVRAGASVTFDRITGRVRIAYNLGLRRTINRKLWDGIKDQFEPVGTAQVARMVLKPSNDSNVRKEG